MENWFDNDLINLAGDTVVWRVGTSLIGVLAVA